MGAGPASCVAATIRSGAIAATSNAAPAQISPTETRPARPRRYEPSSTAPTRVDRSARLAIARNGAFADDDIWRASPTNWSA